MSGRRIRSTRIKLHFALLECYTSAIGWGTRSEPFPALADSIRATGAGRSKGMCTGCGEGFYGRTEPVSDVVPGSRHGEWTVLRLLDGRPSIKAACVCSCGIQRDVWINNPKSGMSRSCGHINHGSLRHGMSQSPEYSAWSKMKERCTNASLEDW